MTTLIDQAIQIAQEHGLKIIACGADKAPIHKGWRGKASSDPDEIREMFSDPRAKLVGVPMGPVNDLITFDIDYREGNTDARNAALRAIEDEILGAYEGVRVHRTRNGGKHLIMLNPEGVKKIPRNLMPKLEMVPDGFQIIWPTEGSGYEVLEDVALDDLDEPDARFLKVREKMKGISSSGGLMDEQLAKEIMVSDGEVGTRHDALLRMTYDFVGAAPAEMAPDQLCQSFEAQFREVFGDHIEESRLEELMHWTWDGEHLGGSDLGNAMKGAIERHPERALGALSSMERPGFSVWDEAPGAPAEIPVEPAPPSPELPRREVPSSLRTLNSTPPAREWILSHRLEKQKLSLLQGWPGGGKSSLVLLWCTAVASGTNIVWETTYGGPRKVIYWNGEDGIDELERRRYGIYKEYKTAALAADDNLMILASDVEQRKLVSRQPAGADGTGPLVAGEDAENIQWLEDLIDSHEAELLVIDPLVTGHKITETDPEEMEILLGVLRRIARDRNIAILVVHHKSSKTGLPSLIGAARHVISITSMKEASGTVLGKDQIPVHDQYRYIRADSVKSNNSEQARPRWIELKPVMLGNGNDTYMSGDSVAIPVRWDGTASANMLAQIGEAVEALNNEWTRDVVNEGDRLVREDPQAGAWFGRRLAAVFDKPWQRIAKKDMSEEELKNHEEMRGLISAMIEHNILSTVMAVHDDYKEKPCLKVNEKGWERFKKKHVGDAKT